MKTTLYLSLAATASLLLAAGCGGSGAHGAPNLLPGETVVDDSRDPTAAKRRGEQEPGGGENDIVRKQMEQGREGVKPK